MQNENFYSEDSETAEEEYERNTKYKEQLIEELREKDRKKLEEYYAKQEENERLNNEELEKFNISKSAITDWVDIPKTEDIPENDDDIFQDDSDINKQISEYNNSLKKIEFRSRKQKLKQFIKDNKDEKKINLAKSRLKAIKWQEELYDDVYHPSSKNKKIMDKAASAIKRQEEIKQREKAKRAEATKKAKEAEKEAARLAKQTAKKAIQIKTKSSNKNKTWTYHITFTTNHATAITMYRRAKEFLASPQSGALKVTYALEYTKAHRPHIHMIAECGRTLVKRDIEKIKIMENENIDFKLIRNEEYYQNTYSYIQKDLASNVEQHEQHGVTPGFWEDKAPFYK